MTQPTAVIDVVGLTPGLLAHAPRLRAWAGRVRTLVPVLPAVTCTVQSSMLTGLGPSGHGVVANGWYHRDTAEVRFWLQSNRLVAGEKVWETARRRDPSVTCANMFWWFNMYSSVDVSVTPRPMYTADGRKIPDVHSDPPQLREQLQQRLGRFPLFSFWGPAASIESSAWIAEATAFVAERHDPTLLLAYLPHLDYDLQRLGPGHPDIPREVAAIDGVAADLIERLEARGRHVIVVSEYGIEPVDGAVALNRHLREAGWLRVRGELGREMLDAGGSDAFAVADHQVAHVYVRDASRLDAVAERLAGVDGVEQVLRGRARAKAGLDHERSGELVAVATRGRWFSYPWWLDDARAPDYARTVDIHRKPGYDPCELFIDPGLAAPRLRIAMKLLRRKLGFRGLLDVIPLDASLVRGSHGRTAMPAEHGPLLLERADHGGPDTLNCTKVRDVVLERMLG